MTFGKQFLLIVLAMVALGGAIMYETVKSVEHIKTQIIQINKGR
jgi:hypothetical protein